MIIKCVIFSLFLIVPFSFKEDYYAFHFFHVVSCRRTCFYLPNFECDSIFYILVSNRK